MRIISIKTFLYLDVNYKENELFITYFKADPLSVSFNDRMFRSGFLFFRFLFFIFCLLCSCQVIFVFRCIKAERVLTTWSTASWHRQGRPSQRHCLLNNPNFKYE